MHSASLAAHPEATAEPDTFREAFARLGAARPTARSIARPAGRVVAAAAYRLGLTPNALTLLSAGFTIFGVLLLAAAPASFGVGAGVAALLALGYVLQSAGAQLALLHGGATTAGEWLGHTVDAVKVVGVHAAVLVTAYRSIVPAGHPELLLLPLAFAVVASVSFAVSLLNGLLKAAKRRSAGVSLMPEGASMGRSLLAATGDHGLLVLAFLLIGWSSAFLTVYGLLLIAAIAALLLGLPRWYGEMTRFDVRQKQRSRGAR